MQPGGGCLAAICFFDCQSNLNKSMLLSQTMKKGENSYWKKFSVHVVDRREKRSCHNWNLLFGNPRYNLNSLHKMKQSEWQSTEVSQRATVTMTMPRQSGTIPGSSNNQTHVDYDVSYHNRNNLFATASIVKLQHYLFESGRR